MRISFRAFVSSNIFTPLARNCDKCPIYENENEINLRTYVNKL